MIKSFILVLTFLVLPLSTSFAAYTSTLKILDKPAISRLTDDELTNTYMDTLVEVDVRKDYFNHFGLAGKDLEDYKAVMKYRLVLLMEIHSRNLDIPQFERY